MDVCSISLSYSDKPYEDTATKSSLYSSDFRPECQQTNPFCHHIAMITPLTADVILLRIYLMFSLPSFILLLSLSLGDSLLCQLFSYICRLSAGDALDSQPWRKWWALIQESIFCLISRHVHYWRVLQEQRPPARWTELYYCPVGSCTLLQFSVYFISAGSHINAVRSFQNTCMKKSIFKRLQQRPTGWIKYRKFTMIYQTTKIINSH